MSAEQHHLRRFFDAELAHSLGAHRVASEALTQLEMELLLSTPEQPREDAAEEDIWLVPLTATMTSYNVRLHDLVHAASVGPRHPAPLRLPWSEGRLFDRQGGLPPSLPASEDWMVGYYEAALEALTSHRSAVTGAESPQGRLARWLLRTRDGSTYSGSDQTSEAARQRLDGRVERYEGRLEVARSLSSTAVPKNLAIKLAGADLVSTPEIAKFVLSAFVEGHLLTHGVEWSHSGHLDDHIDRSREATDAHLKRAQALLTFAYSISRTCPWIFAAGPEETAWVHAHASMCWDQMVPTMCLWLATQLPLLALHRRAYARALAGEPERAYKDYYKLQQQIRHADRRLRTAPSAVVGAPDFLAALDAIADHHIGELYRSKQAHTAALAHLTRADARLERLRTRGTDRRALPDEALTSSRWRIELLLSNGKAHYEMGRHKNSLSWYLRAWKAVLELHGEDNGTQINADPIDAALAWLAAVAHEPVIYKDDVDRYLRPIVAQLDGILINERLGALAADVLTRLGHLLFVLRTDAEEDWSPDADGQIDVPVLKLLLKAAQCDSASTMLRADLLKLVYRLLEDDVVEVEELDGLLRTLEPVGVGKQWQGGEDDFARMSRATEYVLLQELLTAAKTARKRRRKPTDAAIVEQQRTEAIARRLLAGVFIHTDSINVRRAQVHERLAAPRKRFEGTALAAGPIVELVSMRRFSSAFALLPRPAAFRSLSGGYFVRIRATPHGEPFGIAIDPGTDFVETMFRTGFSMADVQMIVVTHDHVDHMAALEPLLSLLYERTNIDDQAPRCLPLLGNRGVLERHRGTRQYRQLALYDFADEDLPWGEADWKDSGKEMPQPLASLNAWLTKRLRVDVELVSVSSAKMGGEGHLDNSRQPSYGFALRVGGAGGPSVAFTSDMPRPTGDCSEALAPLLACDVVIAHLSSLPLSELRKMAGLGDRTTHAATSELEDRTRLLALFADAREHPDNYESNLASRLQYAYWLDRDSPVLLGPSQLAGEQWMPAHLYLHGLLSVARAARARRPDGLFVVGELSEELGSLRGKIAHWMTELDDNADRRWKALTADIGLDVLIGCAPDGDEPSVWVRCDTCDLDNDLADGERYHPPRKLHEVCIKGENEGIFYNCSEHDPRQQRPPMFLERLERYDMFGR